MDTWRRRWPAAAECWRRRTWTRRGPRLGEKLGAEMRRERQYPPDAGKSDDEVSLACDDKQRRGWAEIAAAAEREMQPR
jgi:hypothetical protein